MQERSTYPITTAIMDLNLTPASFQTNFNFKKPNPVQIQSTQPTTVQNPIMTPPPSEREFSLMESTIHTTQTPPKSTARDIRVKNLQIELDESHEHRKALITAMKTMAVSLKQSEAAVSAHAATDFYFKSSAVEKQNLSEKFQ